MAFLHRWHVKSKTVASEAKQSRQKQNSHAKSKTVALKAGTLAPKRLDLNLMHKTRVVFFLDCQKKVDSQISVFCLCNAAHDARKCASTMILSAKCSKRVTMHAKCTNFWVTCQFN